MSYIGDLEAEAIKCRQRLRYISVKLSEHKHGFRQGQSVMCKGRPAIVEYGINDSGCAEAFISVRVITKLGEPSLSVQGAYHPGDVRRVDPTDNIAIKTGGPNAASTE